MNQTDLNQFTGTENYYHHPLRRLVYTDGVKYLADAGNAFWLIDAIASYQIDPRLTKHNELRNMQFWKLVKKDNGVVMTCVADSGRKPTIIQSFESTNFPLDEVEVWVERGSIDGITECMVAMLPSER